MGFICVLTRVSTVHLFKKLGQILNSFSWSGIVKHLTIYLSDELRRNMVFVPLFMGRMFAVRSSPYACTSFSWSRIVKHSTIYLSCYLGVSKVFVLLFMGRMS